MQFPHSTQTLRSTITPSRTWVDRSEELAFAERAAVYLDKQGLDHRAVVKCLIEEFELDRETAEAVASLAA
jgi:hypothetical protein